MILTDSKKYLVGLLFPALFAQSAFAAKAVFNCVINKGADGQAKDMENVKSINDICYFKVFMKDDKGKPKVLEFKIEGGGKRVESGIRPGDTYCFTVNTPLAGHCFPEKVNEAGLMPE